MLKKFIFTQLLAGLLTPSVFAQNVSVEVNPEMKRVIGNIDSFDRQKFITIHSDIRDREWEGDNKPGDLRKNFLEKYDVFLGRNTGGITYWLKSETTEDPTRKGYANPADVSRLGNFAKSQYAANLTAYAPYEKRNLDNVICAQLHPFWPDGEKTSKGWAFSQTDTPQEPFGTATGTYMAQYIEKFYGAGGTSGENTPAYVEVINEPVWHLVDYGNETPEKIFRFHNSVADAIKKQLPNLPIGGYCAAFPNLDKNNFQEWEERMKLFMDVAGENMDFWTIHLYDFPAFQNTEQYRKGSNMEATFDMIEQYSFLKFGTVKPFMVSEYGAQMHKYSKQWSPFRDWLSVKSINSMLMQFMERPDIINKTIPFIIVKAEWGRQPDGTPYNHRLLRQAKEVPGETGGDQYVYTEMVKFYQLWSDIKGTRVDSKSDNLDIMCDSYVNGDTLYVILNNLKFEAVDIDLDINNASTSTIKSVESKHLYLSEETPVLKAETLKNPPGKVRLEAEGTMILAYTYHKKPAISELVSERKYYAQEFYKNISPGIKNTFSFSGIEVKEFHEATLRIGVGRNHGLSLYPTVLLNGVLLDVPKDFRGDDQRQRPNFFGVLEVPVPKNILKDGQNSVEITFPDNGGKISSVTMRVSNFSKEVKRIAQVITGSSVEPVPFDLLVFPNPFTHEVTVRTTTTSSKLALSVQSLDGKELLLVENVSPETSLDLRKFPAGAYIISINDGKRLSQKKVVLR